MGRVRLRKRPATAAPATPLAPTAPAMPATELDASCSSGYVASKSDSMLCLTPVSPCMLTMQRNCIDSADCGSMQALAEGSRMRTCSML